VVAELGSSTETLLVINASRYVGEVYECVADNGVPPAVSRQMKVTVQCILFFICTHRTVCAYSASILLYSNSIHIQWKECLSAIVGSFVPIITLANVIGDANKQ